MRSNFPDHTNVRISRNAIYHNLSRFKRRIGPAVKLMAVVKANAYGHGISEVAGLMVNQKVDWLGVNSLEEGSALRREKVRLPILVLGSIPPGQIKMAIEADISFVAFRRETIIKADREAKKCKKKAKIHLKLETGTNRLGIKSEDLGPLIRLCRRSKGLVIEGAYTHFANIEDTLDDSYPKQQLANFTESLRIIEAAGIEVPVKHTACSAAAILFDETHFDLVRVGIGLYGYWPSAETKLSAKERGVEIDLKPALTWETRVVQVKTIKKGETVGYGRTYKAVADTKIAVLPVGYWDGYDRRLSGIGEVLVKGQLAPVIGRVCMNMTMIEVTHLPQVKVGEKAVLLGSQEGNQITAESIAQKIGTVNYEVVTRINPLLPRKIV